MKKAHRVQLQLTPTAHHASYDMANTLLCSYLRVLDMRKAVKDFPDEMPVTRVKANSGVPANIVYYIDENGMAYKYQLIDSDLDLSYE